MTMTATIGSSVRRPATNVAPPAAPVRLRARAGGRGTAAVEMELTDLRAEVAVAGLAAEVTLVMTFYNPHAREMEGQLLFPLPEGAAVCGYGLDVDGELADASLVDRDKARQAFEAEARRVFLIDPGLAEYVRGNVFRTRIYPLPPRGKRQVKVQYVADLTVAADGSGVLDVPLATTGPLGTLDLRVTVAGAGRAELAGGGVDWADAGFVERDGRLVAEVRRRDVRPDGLRVVLPAVPAGPAAMVEVTDDGERYFAVHHVVPEPPDAVAAARGVRLVWDASLSRAMADMQKEFDALARVLGRVRDAEVELVVVRHRADAARRFRVADGDAGPLLEYLRGLTYDGGTSLCETAAAVRRRGGHDLTLLFADAIGTVDEEDGLPAEGDPPEPPAAPVYAFTAAPHAHHAVLRQLAHGGGGEFFNLARIPAETAADRAGRPAYTFVSADVTDGEAADLLPAGPCPARGAFTLAGRLLSPRATVRLNFRRPDGSAESVDRLVDGSTAAAGRVVPRLWAQQQVAALSAWGGRHRDRMRDLGRRFGLVTPGTSLLVLETLWQHLTHGIEPAPSRRKLYHQYHQQLALEGGDDGDRPANGPGQGPNAEDERARVELLQFYARLTMGDGVDVSWLAERTEGVPAADVVQVIDDARFLARSRGRTKVERQDLESAGLRVFRRPVSRWPGRRSPGEPPVASDWRGRVAWWGRSFDPPDGLVETVLPDNKQWGWAGRSSAAFASRGAGDLDDDLRPVLAEADGGGIDLVLSDVSMDIDSVRSIDRTMDRRTFDDISLSAIAASSPAGLSDGRGPNESTRPAVPWRPADRPAVTAPANEAAAEAEYLRQRPRHAADPAFYVDWADLFLTRCWTAAGVRVLTNLAELEPDDAPNLRALAYRLEAAGEDELAATCYARVLRLRPEEPQGYRDLALALSHRPGHDRRAADLLAAVVHGRWDGRFRGIEATALIELNALAARHERAHPGDRVDIAVPPDRRHVLDLDLRIVLDWDADMADLDLWVVEPSGELCRAADLRHDGTSSTGGLVPRDQSGGYGPEEYLLRHAAPGTYRVLVRYARNEQHRLRRPTTLKVTVVRDFGRTAERRRVFVRRMTWAEPPAAVRSGAEIGAGCGLTAVGLLLAFVGGLLAINGAWSVALWLGAAAVVCWVAAAGWGWCARAVGRRYRLRKNVMEVMTVTV